MNELKKSIQDLTLELPKKVGDEALEKLSEYALILKTSPRKSFASWDSDASGIEMHFKDSLMTFPEIQVSSFIDVGSGAGVPGIIYALLMPQTKSVLLDSQTLRCEFMQDAVKKLGLEDRVTVVCGRAEKEMKKPGLMKSFDLVTARALAPFPEFFRYVSGFVKPGGYIHAIRGSKDIEYFLHPEKFKEFHLTLVKYEIYHVKKDGAARITSLLKLN